jgi:hypothetical protein
VDGYYHRAGLVFRDGPPPPSHPWMAAEAVPALPSYRVVCPFVDTHPFCQGSCCSRDGKSVYTRIPVLEYTTRHLYVW